MATQRITIATIAGKAGRIAAGLFRRWHTNESEADREAVRSEVDEFVEQLRGHGGIPPVLFFCEWFDLWSMGDSIHFEAVVNGKRFEASCGSRNDSMAKACQLGDQFPEEQWLATRLQEASEASQTLAAEATVVIARQVLGPSCTVEEAVASLSAPSFFTD